MAGRPSLYKSSYNKQAYKLALLGATDKEIADFFDVHEDTINEWKKVYPQFSVSINKGKLKADAEVANSLYKRAIGFEYDEVTFEKVDSKVNLEVTSEGEIKTDESYKKKVVTKVVVPDVAAINIWLKNRRGKVPEGAQKWADKHETDVTSGGEKITGFTVEIVTNDEPAD